MTSNKVGLSIVSAALVVGVAAGPLFSYGAVSQTNQNTGADSKNRNRARLHQRVDHSQTNSAAAATSLDATVNTGGNKVKKNTTAGSLTSGAVNGTVTVENTLNPTSPLPIPPLAPLDVEATQLNRNTGAGSTNKNKLKVSNSQATVINTAAATATNINFVANTGDNTSSENTSAGDLTSGDVTVSFGVTNTLN